MLIRYFFHIVDNQFNDEYDYIAHFKSHDEASRFIKENEDDGNVVTINAPYYLYVDANTVDTNSVFNPIIA